MDAELPTMDLFAFVIMSMHVPNDPLYDHVLIWYVITCKDN